MNDTRLRALTQSPAQDILNFSFPNCLVLNLNPPRFDLPSTDQAVLHLRFTGGLGTGKQGAGELLPVASNLGIRTQIREIT